MYRLPTFNLECGIWHGLVPPIVPVTPADVEVECQLRWTYRGQDILRNTDAPTQFWQPGQLLLLPALTDVRDVWNGAGADMVEVPLGSGCYYIVHAVGEVGKGFDNEHRCAYLARFVIALPQP